MAKGGKKKKQVLKFTLDCTHPVEDGIMDAANFVSYPPDATLDSSEPFWILLRRHTGACLFAGSGCSAVLAVGFDSGSLSGSGSKPCFLRDVTVVKSKGDALEQVTARGPHFLLRFPKRVYLKFIR